VSDRPRSATADGRDCLCRGERDAETDGRTPISPEQLDTNEYNRFDVRASKAIGVGGSRQVEFIAQVFNLFGKDNLGGIDSGWTQNALSNSFGRISSALPRQEAELAVRFRF
jgi:hypothetical protein